MSAVAEVRLWGTRLGVVSLEAGAAAAVFQYEPAFLASGIEVSPLQLPLSARQYTFPELPARTFHGLPGLLADSLPDKFGRALIQAWLVTQGRTFENFSPIEQLCYVGVRGPGALEYHPMHPTAGPSQVLQVQELVALANEILTQREGLHVSFATQERKAALTRILLASSSAGGARAKAAVAWNPETNEVRSGQVAAPTGFEHWLIKFDGVSDNKDKDPLGDPKGYTVAEYAYSLLAKEAGIQMSESRLLKEGGRRHFMTKRFDRAGPAAKLHMQSLGALAHLDYNNPAANSYEQAFEVLHRLRLGSHACEQLFRRMLFNVMARNQDDHVKNIAFLMDRRGQWSLAPAYDLAYNHNPAGTWTAQHQMSLNGKRDGFTREDLNAVAVRARISNPSAKRAFEAVHRALGRWQDVAQAQAVPDELAAKIHSGLRLEIR